MGQSATFYNLHLPDWLSIKTSDSQKWLENNMIPTIRILLTVMALIIGVKESMAIEEAVYIVVLKEGVFEIRDYAPHILAETIVEGKMKEAGSKAFSILFKYISGDNRSQGKIEMTTPVSQTPRGEKIEMTAPVGQQYVQGQWAVSFMMPAKRTIETLPEPEDQRVSLRKVAARRVATIRYSGFWSEKRYLRYLQKLEAWVQNKGFRIVGEAIWARYNPPFTPWFLRRNEILIPIEINSD